MVMNVVRTLFTVFKDERGWVVESAGKILGRHADKEEAKAAAYKRARVSQDAGKPCMVRVSGEHGFVAKSDDDIARLGPTLHKAALRPFPI